MIKRFVLKVADQLICFEDRLQGETMLNLKHDLGDLLTKTRDGIISYQLAVVVDDYLQGLRMWFVAQIF